MSNLCAAGFSTQWVCGEIIRLRVVVLPLRSVFAHVQTQLLCSAPSSEWSPLPRLGRLFLKAGQRGPHGEGESRKTCPTNTTNNHWRRLSSASIQCRGGGRSIENSSGISESLLNNLFHRTKHRLYWWILGADRPPLQRVKMCIPLSSTVKNGSSRSVLDFAVSKWQRKAEEKRGESLVQDDSIPSYCSSSRLSSFHPRSMKKWLKTQTSPPKELLTHKECPNEREGLKHALLKQCLKFSKGANTQTKLAWFSASSGTGLVGNWNNV